jgi:hypothetical protein
MATISNHLRGTSELMLIADIKDGFVQQPERLVSHATRLGQLLELLLQGRRVAAEVRLLPGAGPIERLDTIFSTQWAIRQRPQRAELIVSAVFDSSWESYCRNLQTNAGELLDAIFCHCTGYEQHTCVDAGYEKFSSWLRERQVQTRFFHTATPDLTVTDLRGLRRFASGDLDVRTPIPSVEQAEALLRNAWPAPSAASRQARAIEREHLLNSMIALAGSFPASEKVSERRNARDVYEAAVRSLLESSLDADLQRRARELGLLPSAASAGGKREVDAPIPPSPNDIQHDILTTRNDGSTWENRIKHGCLVMIQCDDSEAALSLLRALLPRISREQTNDAGLQLNLALTHAGMTRLGLSESTLELLPPEFRQGMESRAGLLGDVGPHAHPDTWERLSVNWPRPSQQTTSLSCVDVVLLVQRVVLEKDWTENDHIFAAKHPLFKDVKELKLEQAGVHILHVQPLRRYSTDHFGLGEESQPASQPILPWPPTATGEPSAKSRQSRHEIPLGEVLLGHRNRHGGVAEWALDPAGRWLFENGTFLVVRKLQQDVAAFRSHIARCARELGVSAPLVQGWILGRNPADGRTLAAPGAPNPGNEFDYSSPEAAYCPRHAHVRRANPRLADSPRILRRSFPYGSEYDPAANDTERGLMFMAYNASIAEQFEVIQRWLNGGNATGLPSIVNDLIAGVPQSAGAVRDTPGNGTERLPPPERPFVSLRWGLYAFVPSLSAIARLLEQSAQPVGRYTDHAAAKKATKAAREPSTASVARRARRSTTARAPLPAKPAEPPLATPPEPRADLDGLEARGRRTISEILGIENAARQREAWKEVLEEPTRVADARAVWAAIGEPSMSARLASDFPRYAAGLLASPPSTLPTPYGLLVSRYAHASEILNDDGARFSVDAYRQRFGATIGAHYLGFDRKDAAYDDSAPRANEYLSGLPLDGVYRAANRATSSILAKAAPATIELPGSVDLVELALNGIGSVAADYLFTREYCGDRIADFVRPFIPISRYCFQPYPDSKLKAQAEEAGKKLMHDSEVALLSGPFADHLRKKPRGSYDDESLVRLALIGAMVGFAPPAVAHVIFVLTRWLQSGQLQRHARKSPESRRRALLTTMTEVPVPPTLYRTIRSGARLGDRDLSPLVTAFGCEFVVVGTQSVTLDARRQRLSSGATGDGNEWQWLFGGDRRDTSQPGAGSSALPAVHGCPARSPAVAAISGIVDAVSNYPDARLCGPQRLIPGKALR